MNDEANQQLPRAFISYSWTTPEYEQRVLAIAKRLRADGIDVILDKWELREGHDKYSFMERMVTDESVGKVIVFSDSEYARKADSRAGGVGTETQIISQELYGSVEQDKFIPVLMERNEEDGACLPTFLGERIMYIDFSSAQSYAENYEALVRSIFGKPLFTKPGLGSPPAYLDSEPAGGPYLRPVLDTYKLHVTNGNMRGGRVVLEQYLSSLSESVRGLRVHSTPDGTHLDELVTDRFHAFTPYRDEFADLIQFQITAALDTDEHEPVLRFLERALSEVNSRDKTRDAENLATYELTIYLIAILAKGQELETLAGLFDHSFYSVRREEAGLRRLWEHRFFPASIEKDRQRRLGSNRISAMADLINQRAGYPGIDFHDLAQGELLLYIRAMCEGEYWWPRLLILETEYHVMELFARARSSRVFTRLLRVLGASSKEDLQEKVRIGVQRHPQGPDSGFWRFPEQLARHMNINELAGSP